MAITVPEAAKRIGKNPETIRRWIREGKLAAQKVGTQHLIDEAALDAHVSNESDTLPTRFTKTFWGGPMPTDIVRMIREDRDSH